VCGAWHAPVLRAELLKKEDQARLKSLKKVATETTWIPWTYERLSFSSGYGAGVLSPAWYELLFAEPRAEVLTHWMVRATRLLRGQDVDASSAHAIEGVRLAGALAAPLRGVEPFMGLEALGIAFVVVVVGGIGSFAGALLGGLLIGVVQSVMSSVWPEGARLMIYAAMAAVRSCAPKTALPATKVSAPASKECA